MSKIMDTQKKIEQGVAAGYSIITYFLRSDDHRLHCGLSQVYFWQEVAALSVYFIANIHIHDDSEYEKYRRDVDQVFSQYRGEYLALDDAPVVLEGSWNYKRAVLIRFPDREALDAWYFSPEYQRILRHRLKGARCDTIIIQGN